MDENFNDNTAAVANSFNFSHKKFAFKFIILIFLIFIISGVIVTLIFSSCGKELNSIVQGASQLIFMLAPTIYFAKKSPLTFKQIFRFEKTPSLSFYILSILGFIGLFLFSTTFIVIQESLIPSSLLDSYHYIEKFVSQMYVELLGGSGLISIIIAMFIGAIIPAISEETLFRGLFQRSLEEELKPQKAIIIAGLIFALIHFNPIGLITLIIIGLYLGFLAYSTESLLIPIIIHFINNALSIIILHSPTLKVMDDNAYGLTLFQSIPLCIIGLFILTGTVYYINKSSVKKI